MLTEALMSLCPYATKTSHSDKNVNPDKDLTSRTLTITIMLRTVERLVAKHNGLHKALGCYVKLWGFT